MPAYHDPKVVWGDSMIRIAQPGRTHWLAEGHLWLTETRAAMVGAGFLAAALAVPHPLARIVLLAIGCGTLSAVVVMAGSDLVGRVRRRLRCKVLGGVIARDTVPKIITDDRGYVLGRNPAAAEHFGPDLQAGLGRAFRDLFAAPAAMAAQLMAEAVRHGAASADRVSHAGQVRVSVVAAPGGLYLWRVESLTARSARVGTTEIGLPLVAVDGDQRIIGANAAMIALVGQMPEHLDGLLDGAKAANGAVVTVPTREGPRPFRMVEVAAGAGACREVYLLPFDMASATSAAQLFDTLPVPMLKVRLDGRILAANHGACDLLGRGIAPDTLLAEVLSGLGRSLTDWLQDAVSGRAPSRSEFLQVRGLEDDRFVQVSLKPVEEAGEMAVIAVLTDATELKTLEAQFVQSQKMQAIGQLAGGVAHDFNNLLTAISGHCDLLLMRHDERDPSYGDLVQINQNANRAASLVGQLLAFSRKQTLSPETVDLRDVLSDLTHLLSRLVGETVRLVLRHDEAVPRIRVDKRQLEQVIMNLVVNARDAMPDGGEIRVETSALTLETELRRNRAVIPAGDYAVVRVIDQGVGISPENLQKIFEPFYTTKKTGEGTGLGLSTAYGIVKQTGGFIFADSVPGEGTVFTLYFPAHGEAAAAVPQPAAAAAEPDHGRTDGVVLLVEDEAPVRAFASRALRLRGFTVIEAENAEQALERLADPELAVDVFVTDVVMPGMDGPSWVREALKARPDTRVIFVSGYAEDALSDHQARIPNSVFLPKPFSLQQLTTTVQSQLH
jgi:two-component system cell cycle sensor histidine kinase/response regulator CckA